MQFHCPVKLKLKRRYKSYLLSYVLAEYTGAYFLERTVLAVENGHYRSCGKSKMATEIFAGGRRLPAA